MNDIESKILKIYRVYCKTRRINSNSQLSMMWNNNVEIFHDTEELMALEDEFGIEIDEETAGEIYDMTISEVAIVIENLINVQNKNKYVSDSIIDSLSTDEAKNLLISVWRNHVKARYFIKEEIERIRFEQKK
jgi:hypothetical protein